MVREATLFEDAEGSPLRGFLLLKGSGSGNIPTTWIDRAHESRKNREERVAEVLQNGDLAGLLDLEDWEQAFFKGRFYLGIRVLLELERQGRSKR